MRRLSVSIEINGIKEYVGSISGDGPGNAVFSYAKDYLSGEDRRAISLSLPLREEPYPPAATKAFFEGLLPEGYTRRSVAEWMHVDEDDYLSILAGLGRECIGAVQVIEGEPDDVEPGYRRLSLKEIRELAAEGSTESTQMLTESHLSLAGASGKVGLYRYGDEEWYLPVGDAPSTHIVKQSHVRLDNIVLNERLVMITAGRLGIDVPESFVINTGRGTDRDVLFAVRRFDRDLMSGRVIDGRPCPYRRHQEDMAQALGIPAAGKYEREAGTHLKMMADLLRYHSADPIDDLLRLWDLTVFNWLAGNTDNHIKNLAILYSPDLKSIRLAPAYDLLSTKIYRGSTRDMSFSIGGRYRLEEIGKEEWKKAASDIGINPAVAIDRLYDMKGKMRGAMTDASRELCDEMGAGADSRLKRDIGDLASRILQ